LRRNQIAGKKSNGGFSLNVFTEDECNEIHLATLEVLEKTGMFVEDQQALELFGDNGATVDKKRKIAKLPPHMIEDAIRSAPSKVFLAGRNPKNDFVMENRRVGFTNFGEGVQIVDPDTGVLRKTKKQDVANTAKVVDYLDEIDVYLRAVGAHEVPQEVAPLHNAEAFFPNTSKHCFIGPIDGFNVKKLVEMARVIAGGEENLKERPLMSFNTCPVSPLKLVKDACEIIMEGARNGIAVNVLSMAMAGGSTPVNMAGTLVDHNAEVLTGIALGQLTKKGTPMIYGSSTTAMDLRFGTASVGSPECGMINAAVARLGNYYGLPTWAAGG
jgi:trimethylamine--corrinoid protein Co-methyltransferase